MARPEFPGCVLPASSISRIIEKQKYYDENPERYEREEVRKKEERQLEQEQLYEEYKRQQERESE